MRSSMLSLTLSGVVHTANKGSIRGLKWSLTRGSKRWKTIKPSGQRVFEVAFESSSFTRGFIIGF